MISEAGDSTASLNSLCQCSVTSTVKEAFPYLQVEPPVFQFVPCHWAVLKRAFIYFVPSLQIFIYIDKVLPKASVG